MVTTDETGQRHQEPTVGARKSLPLEGFLPIFQSFLNGNLVNPDNIPPQVYRRMQDTDETVSSGLDFIQLTVMAYLGAFRIKHKRAQKYIDELWWNCYVSLEQVVEELLQALCFGWSLGELVLRKGDDDLVWLDDVPFLTAESTTIQIETDRPKQNFGRPIGFRQANGAGPLLDFDQMVYYAHRSRQSNPYGQSRLKPAYKSWVLKDVLLKDYGLAMSTFGSPISLAQMANPKLPEVLPDGTETTAGQVMLNTLKNLSGGSSVVMGLTDKVTLEKPSVSVGGDFKEAEDHLNKCILRSLLIPALLFEPTDIGSFALGSKHFEIFLRSIGRIVADIQRVLILQVYQPLLRLNFGKKVPRGHFEMQKLEEEDLDIWARIFYSLTNAGFVSNQDLEDYNAVRAKFNLQPRDKVPPPPPKPETPPSIDPGQPPRGGGKKTGQTADDVPRSGSRVPKTKQGRPARKAA